MEVLRLPVSQVHGRHGVLPVPLHQHPVLLLSAGTATGVRAESRLLADPEHGFWQGQGLPPPAVLLLSAGTGIGVRMESRLLAVQVCGSLLEVVPPLHLAQVVKPASPAMGPV